MRPIVFRDLPGIASIEQQYLLDLNNNLMKDEREALLQAIDEKSVELFGITERDTLHWLVPAEAKPGTEEQWERHFEFIEEPYDEENDFWAFFGIDVADEDGDQLACMFVFGRQLVCALKRLHPKAIVSFREGEQSADELQASAEAWAMRLLRGKDPNGQPI